jgi:hypothetical protein
MWLDNLNLFKKGWQPGLGWVSISTRGTFIVQIQTQFQEKFDKILNLQSNYSKS